MSKEEMMQEIIEMAAHNMDWFIGIIGLLLAFFAYFQWRLSQSQLDNMKKKIKEEIVKEYSLDEINKIGELENTITQMVINNVQTATNEIVLIDIPLNEVSFFRLFGNLIRNLEVLAKRKPKKYEFIEQIAGMFSLINKQISPNNLASENVQIFSYRVYQLLTKDNEYVNC